MLNKIKEKIFGNDNEKLLQLTMEQLKKLRTNTHILVLYGSATENSMLGIANATRSLFPGNSIEIPQWYSNPVFSEKESKAICEEIKQLQFKKVIISGFSNYFFDWIENLSAHTEIEIIFHGTISEFHGSDTKMFIERLIQLGKQKKIKRFGFVKNGLAEIFKNLYEFDCFYIPLSKTVIPTNIKKIELDKNKIHIGVFGADTFNKNLHNQVIHALLFENTVVHVLDKSVFSYLGKNDRIIEHGNNIPRELFLGILGSMNFNLYMSYSESWGLIAYESEALGVPCIKSLDINYFEKIKEQIGNQK